MVPFTLSLVQSIYSNFSSTLHTSCSNYRYKKWKQLTVTLYSLKSCEVMTETWGISCHCWEVKFTGEFEKKKKWAKASVWNKIFNDWKHTKTGSLNTGVTREPVSPPVRKSSTGPNPELLTILSVRKAQDCVYNLKLYFLFYAYVFYLHVCMCKVLCLVPMGLKEGTRSLQPELQAAESHYVGTGNWTLVLSLQEQKVLLTPEPSL